MGAGGEGGMRRQRLEEAPSREKSNFERKGKSDDSWRRQQGHNVNKKKLKREDGQGN